MAVESRRLTMGGPSSVCNTSMRIEDLGHVDTRAVDEFSKFGNFAHLFECKHFISLVTIDRKTGGVVASIF